MAISGQNKSDLHDVVMNYIPVRKTLEVLPPVLKTPLPKLGSDSLTTFETKRTIMPAEKVKIEKVEIKKKYVEPAESPKKKIKRSKRRSIKSEGKETLLQKMMEVSQREELKQSIKKTPLNRSTKKSCKRDYKQGGFIGLEMFDVEPRVHKEPFRKLTVKDEPESSVEQTKSKSRKSFSHSKNTKKGGSRSNKNKSDKKNKSKNSKKRKSSIKVKNTAPSYLRYDLERLLNDNYDNIAFHRIF